jgi:hypothetical protein
VLRLETARCDVGELVRASVARLPVGDHAITCEATAVEVVADRGLGLSIAIAIAERHGGSLTFARSPLGGLRAVLELGSPSSKV